MTPAQAPFSFSDMLKSIRSKLPIQNPLPTFVHNNILQMFEGKDFHDAIAEAGKLYRANPYWPVESYIEKFQEGKITEQDILRAIDHYMASYPAIESLEKLEITSKEYFYRLMFSDLSFNNDDQQQVISDNHLWDLCREKMEGQSLILKRSTTKWRGKDYWEKYQNESFALNVYPFIIRLISTYLDQGQSFWSNPFTSKGFWSFFVFNAKEISGFTYGWSEILLKKVKQYEFTETQEIITEELTAMGIPQSEWENYILDVLFDLKGWAGMVNKLEVEPWQATVKAPNIKLEDYIASLILIESSVDQFHANAQSIELSNIYGRKETVELKSFQLSLAIYQITKSFKLNDRWMQRLQPNELLKIVDEVDESEYKDHVRLWHEAFEHHYYRLAVDAIVMHATHPQIQKPPYAQVLFCIDDREESMRRHLEEVEPEVKTFGVVGFFGIDMKFASLKNQRLIAQCPPVINPSRVITEVPTLDDKSFERWNMLRGSSDLHLYYNSRTLFRGFFTSLVLGVLSIFPMFMQVFFPEFTKNSKKKIIDIFRPEPKTHMMMEPGEEGHGYSKLEQAKIVEAILKMCGLKENITDLVVLMAHGSTSNNNPFKQAYGCGACGGNAGMPNSRAFAQMANDPLVREELKKLNHPVPEGTYFVAGFHDTSTDEVLFFNEENLPSHLRANLDRLKGKLFEASKLNAYERCQRFKSFPKKGTPEDALEHVRERSHDLAQPRPEYGHSSNALAIVAKRDLTKGLYLNRRAFLLTYDWETDPDGSVMAQVVLGGVPVAVNINMDYYFSSVDNDNFGCGSKLPLNMTSLLGVMTGSSSDLRIGLARQMVEIHEPIRNMTIIEAPLERVQKLFDNHPRLKNILYNHWMRLVVKDPVKGWYIFTQKSFELIEVENLPMKHFASSMELIHTTRTEEDFAEID